MTGECDLLDRLAGMFGPTTLGIMGGTFDPIHRGHVVMGEAARVELGLDGVLYIPAGIPSFKRDRRLASPDDRLAMVRLATETLPSSAVSERELRRPGITYTVETLRELRRDCPATVRFVFIMGQDSLESFPLWHQAERIASLCDLAVAARGPAVPTLSECRPTEILGTPVHWLHARVLDISSTAVRLALASGGDVSGQLDPRVATYIYEHGLYGTRRG